MLPMKKIASYQGNKKFSYDGSIFEEIFDSWQARRANSYTVLKKIFELYIQMLYCNKPRSKPITYHLSMSAKRVYLEDIADILFYSI